MNVAPGARDFNNGWALAKSGASREQAVGSLGSAAGLGWDSYWDKQTAQRKKAETEARLWSESAEQRRVRAEQEARQLHWLKMEKRAAYAEFIPIFDLYRQSPNSVIYNDIHQATLHEYCAAAAVSLEKHLDLKIKNPENRLRLQEALYRWTVSNNREVLRNHPDFLIGAYRFVNQTLQSIYKIQREKNIPLRDAKLRWMEDKLQLRDFDEIVLPDSFLATYGQRDLDRPTKTANLPARRQFWLKKLPKYGTAAVAALVLGWTVQDYGIDNHDRMLPNQVNGQFLNVDQKVDVNVLSDGTCEIPDLEVYDGKTILFSSQELIRLRFLEDRRWPRKNTVININSISENDIYVQFKAQNGSITSNKGRQLLCKPLYHDKATISEIRTIRAER